MALALRSKVRPLWSSVARRGTRDWGLGPGSWIWRGFASADEVAGTDGEEPRKQRRRSKAERRKTEECAEPEKETELQMEEKKDGSPSYHTFRFGKRKIIVGGSQAAKTPVGSSSEGDKLDFKANHEELKGKDALKKALEEYWKMDPSEQLSSLLEELTPARIEQELNKHIIGQEEAKRAISIAIRERWRRSRVPEDMRNEIVPSNLLMVGPTGSGKSECARRLAKIVNAPFVKVEATSFTEVGIAGSDTDSMIIDLVNAAVRLEKKKIEKLNLPLAEEEAFASLLSIIRKEHNPLFSSEDLQKILSKSLQSDLFVDIKLENLDKPSDSGARGGLLTLNLDDMFSKIFGKSKKKTRVPIIRAYDILLKQKLSELFDSEAIAEKAVKLASENGIVFIDEVDKLCSSSQDRSNNVFIHKKENVQKELLSIIEGTVVDTTFGAIKTDHILFIASGAFHKSKPSDLLPELQGRLPVRVNLKPLSQQDFKRILTEPKHNLIEQHVAMLKTEGINLRFEESAIDEIARVSWLMNERVENIGARRLRTILSKLLEKISFNCETLKGSEVVIDKTTVHENLDELTTKVDLRKFIL